MQYLDVNLLILSWLAFHLGYFYFQQKLKRS